MSASCPDPSMTDHTSSEEVCRDFMRKLCTRGSNCRYRHPRGSEKTHEFCRDFQKGVCQRPSCKFIHCSAEDEQYYKETGQLPPDLENGENTLVDPGMSTPYVIVNPLCRHFMSGVCKRGSECKFRHGSIGDINFKDRLRNMPPRGEPWLKSPHESPREASQFDGYGEEIIIDREGPPPDKDIPLCKHFMNGVCKRGSECKFRHGDMEFEDRSRNMPPRTAPWMKPPRGPPGEMTPPFDEYGHDLERRRRIAPEPSCYPASRSDDYGHSRTLRDLEEENGRLLRKVEDLSKQVDELTVTNDVLLEQNARLRAAGTGASAVLLAESRPMSTASPVVTPARAHPMAGGAVPYPAPVPAAAPTAQVITAGIQALRASAAGIPTAPFAGGIATVSLAAGGIPAASVPSALTTQFPRGHVA